MNEKRFSIRQDFLREQKRNKKVSMQNNRLKSMINPKKSLLPPFTPPPPQKKTRPKPEIVFISLYHIEFLNEAVQIMPWTWRKRQIPLKYIAITFSSQLTPPFNQWLEQISYNATQLTHYCKWYMISMRYVHYTRANQ